MVWVVALVVFGCETNTKSAGSHINDVVTYDDVITRNIGPEGGVIEVVDPDSPIYGARVEIPSNALTSDTELAIAYVPEPENSPTEVLAAGGTIDFLPDGISFEKDVFLFLPYNDTDNDGFIDQSTINETNTQAMSYNNISGLWQDMSVIDRDVQDNLVQLKTTHFSRYAAVSYLTKLCETIDILTYGPYYFTLYYNYRFPPVGYRASVSDVGADLNVSNATLIDASTADLEYDGFEDFFDMVLDTTIWTWTWKVDSDLTYLSLKVGLEDEEVVTEIKATAPTTLRFSWNFDYEQMAPGEMMVIKFYGTTDMLCTLTDRTPKTPSNLYIAGVTDKSVELAWDEVVNIYGDVMYNLYISEADSGFNSFFTFSTNTATIGGLNSETTYRFKVTTAYENGLESGDSNIVSAETDIANISPITPENIQATDIGSTEFTLSWNSSSDSDGQVVGYNIYISEDGNTYSLLDQTDQTRYRITYLHPSSTYYCKVAAVDNDNAESDLSESVVVSTL